MLVEEPHPQSLASLVELNREYSKGEVAEWLSFREQFLDDFEKEHGRLFCEYCGRDNLVKEHPEGVKKPASLATVDHVMPVSKGGKRFERKNLKLACFPCNQRKADSVPEDV